MIESDNYHDGTFTRWIAALSAATYADHNRFRRTCHVFSGIDAEIADKGRRHRSFTILKGAPLRLRLQNCCGLIRRQFYHF
jgi:hypothetical protein